MAYSPKPELQSLVTNVRLGLEQSSPIEAMSDCLEPFENIAPKLNLPLARFVCGSLRALAFGPTLRLNTSFL